MQCDVVILNELKLNVIFEICVFFLMSAIFSGTLLELLQIILILIVLGLEKW